MAGFFSDWEARSADATMQRSTAALLMTLVPLAGCTTTAVTSRPEPNELIGVWKVDLRPDPAAEGSGAYNHSAVLTGDTLEGLTNSTGRDFLSYWSATKEK